MIYPPKSYGAQIFTPKPKLFYEKVFLPPLGGCLPCGRFVRFCPPPSLIAQTSSCGGVLTNNSQGTILEDIVQRCNFASLCATAINSCEESVPVEFRIFLPETGAEISVVDFNGFVATNTTISLPDPNNPIIYRLYKKVIPLSSSLETSAVSEECMLVTYNFVDDFTRKALVDVSEPDASINQSYLVTLQDQDIHHIRFGRDNVSALASELDPTPSTPAFLSEIDYSLDNQNFAPLPEPGTETSFPGAGNENARYLVLIDKDLVIDLDYEFAAQWRVIVEPGRTITVKSGSQLLVRGAEIVRCTDLWESIIVEPGAQLAIRNSYISGGQTAIRALPGSRANALLTTFENNNVAIASDAQGAIGSINVDMTVQRCTILAPEVRAPLPSYEGFAGIVLDRQSFATLAQNEISEVEFGVRARSSLFLADENFYHDISQIGVRNYGGIAVMQNSRFERIPTGLRSIFGSNFITGNDIFQVQRGLDLIASTNRTHRIENNTLDVSEYALQSRLTFAYGTAPLFAGNSVRIDGSETESFGVGIRDLNDGGGWLLRNNIIRMEKAWQGMHLIGGSGYALSENTLLMNNTQTAMGLHAQGTDALYASCNYFTTEQSGPGLLVGEKTGLLGEMIPNSTLRCNNFEKLRQGLQVTDLNDGTQIEGNVFTEYYDALVYGSEPVGFAVTPQQILNGNQWLGGEMFDAVNWNDDSDNFILSQFQVDTIPSDVDTPNVPGGEEDWFVENNNNEFDCQTSATPCPDFELPPGLNEGENLEHTIATVEPSLEAYSGSLWSSKLHLRGRVEASNTSNATFTSFASSQSSDKVFYEYEDQLYTALHGDEQKLQAYTDLIDERRNLAQQLAEVEIQVADGATGLETTRVDLIAQLEQTAQSAFGIENDLKQEITSALSNTGVAPSGTEIYEQNYQTVMDVVYELNFEPTEELTTSQGNRLMAIAYQCPFDGGEAVYKARALLGVDFSMTNEEVCSRTQGRAARVLNNHEAAVGLSPNPADDFVMLTLDEAATGTAYLTNGFGSVLQTYTIERSRSQEISTVRLTPGIYFIVVDLKGKRPVTERLIVLR